jgi:putative NIF3 family GTP cyclohydrolase 1 type 2
VELGALLRDLDPYFRISEVEGDDWLPAFEHCYPDPYWREYVEPGYEGRWNGLVVRGRSEVEHVVTCVFPSDRIIAGLEPGTLLFSEHPVDFADEPGFLPLSRASFETLRETAAGFFHAHAPLDQHPEVSPSRLIAEALGLRDLNEYFPITNSIPGGAAVIGDSGTTLDELAATLGGFLGAEIPVQVVSRHREAAGRVAVAAGGGASTDVLEASLERGCETYVTGNAVTRCRLDFVREGVAAFNARAEEAEVSVVDATHYGTEKPPQLAMVDWFRSRGLEAEFVPGGPH